jgi:hypothetical protein
MFVLFTDKHGGCATFCREGPNCFAMADSDDLESTFLDRERDGESTIRIAQRIVQAFDAEYNTELRQTVSYLSNTMPSAEAETRCIDHRSSMVAEWTQSAHVPTAFQKGLSSTELADFLQTLPSSAPGGSNLISDEHIDAILRKYDRTGWKFRLDTSSANDSDYLSRPCETLLAGIVDAYGYPPDQKPSLDWSDHKICRPSRLPEKVDAMRPRRLFVVKHNDAPKGVAKIAKEFYRTFGETGFDGE